MINAHRNLLRRANGRQFVDILSETNNGYWVDDSNLLHGPFVRVALIEEAYMQPVINPVSCILHSNAGSVGSGWEALRNWVNRREVTGEPHFQVDNGTIAQFMPLNRRADCNFSANAWTGKTGVQLGAVSFETRDNGAAMLNQTPWTVSQLGMIVGALTAICVTYGVSCGVPAQWDDSGIGHHSLHPYQGVGSKAWTNVRGKTCPGKARIGQMDWVRGEVANRLAAFSNATGNQWVCGQGRPR